MNLSFKIFSWVVLGLMLSTGAHAQRLFEVKDRIEDCSSNTTCVMSNVLSALEKITVREDRFKIKNIKEELRNKCSHRDLTCQAKYLIDAIIVIKRDQRANIEEQRRAETAERRILEDRRIAEEQRRQQQIERDRAASDRAQRVERERLEREKLQCIGTNFHGKWADGGGCEFHGCWYEGGGCNFHGCWSRGGSCNFHGCIKEVPKTKKACI